MELKARTKLACNIAGLDPARFNEAVHFKHYGCAPLTVPGSARIFYLDDIVTLRIFSMLMDAGMSADSAGGCACRAAEVFRNKPEVNAVSYLKTQIGAGHVMAGEIDANSEYTGLPLKGFWMTFDIKSIREQVLARLEEEYSILGED